MNGSADTAPSRDVKMITIIIPMRNEERFVAACLDSVLGQLDGLPPAEILCADGVSTDRTRAIVEAYARRDPRVRLVENPHMIVPTGMNAAIRQARGDVIIRLDCHAEYAPDYLENCLAVLHRTGADNVGGYATTVPATDSRVGRAISAATSCRFGVGGSVFRVGGGEQDVDTVPFGCFRREVFDRFGLYDERLTRNQDNELNSRIRRGGGRIVISPAIKVTYYTRSTFSGLRQQAYYTGLWNPYTLYLVGGGLGWRHFVPMAFVGSLVGFAVLGLFFRPFWAVLGAEVAAYLAAGIVMARAASRTEPPLWPLVLLAFGQLHLAYGLGSFWGLVTAPFKFGLGRRAMASEPLPDRRY